MFNFLGLFKKKPQEEKVSELACGVEELAAKLKEIEQLHFSDFYKEANRLSPELISALKALAESAERLGKSKIRLDMDPRLKKRVEIAQEQISSKTVSACKAIIEREKEFRNFGDVIKLADFVNTRLAGVNMIIAKEAELAEIGFKSEMGKVGNSINNVKQKLAAFNGLVKANEEKFGKFMESTGAAERIAEMLNWIKSREDECAEKQKETEESSREIDSLQKKSGEFEAGAEYKKALADRKRLNEVINEINLLKISFRNSFGSIDKSMKKYLHDFPSSAEKMVEKYFYEPVEGLAADEGLKILEILSGLETQLRNGKIMPEQRDKLLERTSALAGEIPVTAEKIKKLNAEKEAFASTKFILDNAEELKSRIAMKQKQIEALKFEIGRLGAEIIKKREWVEKSKKELEEKLKNVGILVRLGEGTGKTNNQA